MKTTSEQNKRAASHHTHGGWDEGNSRSYGASTVRENAELQAAEIKQRGDKRPDPVVLEEIRKIKEEGQGKEGGEGKGIC